MALLARRRLRLDQVWLLVSPGNPLKTGTEMASFQARLRSAQRIADGRRVIATDLETKMRTRYSVDTLHGLQRRFPRVRFVWLIGADNLLQLPRWRRWMDIVRHVPLAVLPRPPYTLRALSGRAACRLRHARRPAQAASILSLCEPPAWIFLPAPENPLSATAMRAAGQGAES